MSDKQVTYTDFEVDLSHGEFRSFHNGLHILVCGYVIPRNDIFQEYAHLQNEALIEKLFCDFGFDFIHRIKGMFYIILKRDSETTIFNDRLGINTLYYHADSAKLLLSDKLELITKHIRLRFDPIALGIKAILNREAGDLTIFDQVRKLPPASMLKLNKESAVLTCYWSAKEIDTVISEQYTINYFEKLFKVNLSNMQSYFQPKYHSITLTGGKDSRTGLCALLSLGIKPIGLTYGNPESKDAIFASQLAKNADVEHHVFDMPATKESFREITKQITNFKIPWINFHRAHRFFAFQQLEKISSKNQLYVAGYMAGELLMGIYYDDLVFPKQLTDFWENKTPLTEGNILSKLKEQFIKTDEFSFSKTKIELDKLQTLNPNLSIFEKQLHGIFELGIPHHSQDINLAKSLVHYPYPLFLDIDFLDALFRSKFSFKYTNNKTKNIFERYKLYYFNLKLQHKLYPQLSNVPFAKKGNYTTKDYLRGNLYWSLIKVFNFLRDKRKYPPTFVYNESYYQFVQQELTAISNNTNHPIHKFYDLDAALKSLSVKQNLTQEKQWHRYTNILSSYHYFNALEYDI